MAQPTIATMPTDMLILGSGGAGLFAALYAHDADPGAAILITVKGLLGKSGCTRMVQRMTARIAADNTATYREDSQWFTPFYRREGIE
jgi:succinate dehydrogenase/fumarate reductase flavoprotein subunit